LLLDIFFKNLHIFSNSESTIVQKYYSSRVSDSSYLSTQVLGTALVLLCVAKLASSQFIIQSTWLCTLQWVVPAVIISVLLPPPKKLAIWRGLSVCLSVCLSAG